MCRKLVVTNEIFLGARAICYEAYSLPKRQTEHLLPKSKRVRSHNFSILRQQIFKVDATSTQHPQFFAGISRDIGCVPAFSKNSIFRFMIEGK